MIRILTTTPSSKNNGNDLFHTAFRMQTNPSAERKTNHFDAHIRGLASTTFKDIQRTPNTNLEDILKVFRRKMKDRNPVHQQNTDSTDFSLFPKIKTSPTS